MIRQRGRSVSLALATVLILVIASGQTARGDIVTTSPALPPTSAIGGPPGLRLRSVGDVQYSRSADARRSPSAIQAFDLTNPQIVQNGPDQTATFGSTLTGVATELGRTTLSTSRERRP